MKHTTLLQFLHQKVTTAYFLFKIQTNDLHFDQKIKKCTEALEDKWKNIISVSKYVTKGHDFLVLVWQRLHINSTLLHQRIISSSCFWTSSWYIQPLPSIFSHFKRHRSKPDGGKLVSYWWNVYRWPLNDGFNPCPCSGVIPSMVDW